MSLKRVLPVLGAIIFTVMYCVVDLVKLNRSTEGRLLTNRHFG